MVNKIFLVKDENEDAISKAFTGAYRKEENAIKEVELLKSEANRKNKNLIFHKSFIITDSTYDPEKVYIVFNRLLGRKKQLVSIHYSAFNAGQVVQSLRNRLSDNDKKQIFMKIIPLKD